LQSLVSNGMNYKLLRRFLKVIRLLQDYFLDLITFFDLADVRLSFARTVCWVIFIKIRNICNYFKDGAVHKFLARKGKSR